VAGNGYDLPVHRIGTGRTNVPIWIYHRMTLNGQLIGIIAITKKQDGGRRYIRSIYLDGE